MRPAITDNVIKMLSCGLTVRGYAVFQCINLKCSHLKKVCFSCKSRFCPTCGKKLTDQWIEQQKTILPDTQWQHITFTLPAELWPLFRCNRELLGTLSGLAAKKSTKTTRQKMIYQRFEIPIHKFLYIKEAIEVASLCATEIQILKKKTGSNCAKFSANLGHYLEEPYANWEKQPSKD